MCGWSAGLRWGVTAGVWLVLGPCSLYLQGGAGRRIHSVLGSDLADAQDGVWRIEDFFLDAVESEDYLGAQEMRLGTCEAASGEWMA